MRCESFLKLSQQMLKYQSLPHGEIIHEGSLWVDYLNGGVARVGEFPDILTLTEMTTPDNRHLNGNPRVQLSAARTIT